MKTKTLITTILILFVISGLFIWGYAQNSNTSTPVRAIASSGTKSLLSAPVIFYDFGQISMKNGDVTKDFNFTNTTTGDIVIRGLETSCMCTSAFLVEPNGSIDGPFSMGGMGGRTTTNKTIKAGESRILRVTYNPNAHGPAGVGQIDRFITITDSAGNKLQFEIKALVTP